jgi:hypothetical protein
MAERRFHPCGEGKVLAQYRIAQVSLGRESEAYQLFSALCQQGQQLQQLPGNIDYFATSLPNMLVFEDDLTLRNLVEGKLLEGLALLQLRDVATAKACFGKSWISIPLTMKQPTSSGL